jgi:hypothetical protein
MGGALTLRGPSGYPVIRSIRVSESPRRYVPGGADCEYPGVTVMDEPERWTVGRLRADLAGLPSHLPLRVAVAGGDLQVVISGGFGTLHWLDDRPEPDEIDDAYTIVCADPIAPEQTR